jgi:hypothetical protein
MAALAEEGTWQQQNQTLGWMDMDAAGHGLLAIRHVEHRLPCYTRHDLATEF